MGKLKYVKPDSKVLRVDLESLLTINSWTPDEQSDLPVYDKNPPENTEYDGTGKYEDKDPWKNDWGY